MFGYVRFNYRKNPLPDIDGEQIQFDNKGCILLHWPPLMTVTREAPGVQKVQNPETLSSGFSEFGYWG